MGMTKWNKSKKAATSLIAEVDCTEEGNKDLCAANGVQGFPTLKWGDPSALETWVRSSQSGVRLGHSNLPPCQAQRGGARKKPDSGLGDGGLLHRVLLPRLCHHPASQADRPQD